MHGKKANFLIIIENGQLTSYQLDDKIEWEIGRPSKGNTPDIKLHSTTVSRKHGKFQNMDGVWFYIDHNGKNGTVYNRRHISTGLNGRIKPVLLNDGDVFVFGGSNEAVINCKTVLGLYITRDYQDAWRTVDSKGYSYLQFVAKDKTKTLQQPDKGTVVRMDNGLAIYMGDLTYLIGDVEMTGH